MIANTTPTLAQQADMYNLRTTVERKPTQKFTPSTYNQQKTKKKNKSGSEKRRRCKIKQAESEKEKENKIVPSLSCGNTYNTILNEQKD